MRGPVCLLRVIRVVVRNDEVRLTPIADITISHSFLPPPAAEITSFDPNQG
jgi:hypothetical protein